MIPTRSPLAACVAVLAVAAPAYAQDQAARRLAPAEMRAVGTVDEHYQSYNVEMLEVTGGRFWKPYAAIGKSGAKAADDSSRTSRAARRRPA